MNCTEKEQEKCEVEKMGCEGCYYNTPVKDEKENKNLIEEEKRTAEKVGEIIDNAIKESPIMLRQYAELKKKYDELEKQYEHLKNDNKKLTSDYMYLNGYVDGMQYILNLKEEN